jgi:hypothetical protein
MDNDLKPKERIPLSRTRMMNIQNGRKARINDAIRLKNKEIDKYNENLKMNNNNYQSKEEINTTEIVENTQK